MRKIPTPLGEPLELPHVSSRNGNSLVNLGPQADGTIPKPQVDRLRALGAWLAINGKAIYGSRSWKVCGQDDEQFALTTSGKTVYAIKCSRPTRPLTIKATEGWDPDTVESVRLFGADAAVHWEMTPAGLRIAPPEDLGRSTAAWTFAIVKNAEQHRPSVIVDDAEKALRNTGKVDLDGRVRKAE